MRRRPDDPEQLELVLFGARRSKLEIAFWKFHTLHPEVFKTLLKLCRRWRRKRVRRIGIKTIFETARYTVDIEIGGDGLKLNNNHTAYYARLIMVTHPELGAIFAIRRQRIPATIGAWDNETLPPSEHIH